jgi:hypothetical protein
MKVVLTPLAYGARVFEADVVEFGITPWDGACHVALNELGEANVTQAIMLEGHALEHWRDMFLVELRDIGVKCVTWTHVTNGQRRTIRTPIVENCTPGDLAYYAALAKLDRERVP